MSATMDQLAACAEAVASTTSRNEKVALVAAFLEQLDDADLGRAVLLLSGSPYAASDPRKMSVGHATLRAALEAATGWDQETIGTCYHEVGDSGETIALLCRPHTKGDPLPLETAARLYDQLQSSRLTAQKVAILTSVYRQYSVPALKFFNKGITGNLRIGLQAKMVEEAVAAATHQPLELVRAANNRNGDIAGVALAARRGELEGIGASLFHPLDFMLAQPLDDWSALENYSEWLVEDKYDGIRAQVHTANGKVRIFTRGLEDTTASFPEVVLAFSRQPGPMILDGEILAWRDGRALPFNALQQRIARKKVTARDMEGNPVVFLAYDILMHAGQLVIDQPIEARRSLLESLALAAVSPQEALFDIEKQFTASRDRGNEGLVLKRRGSVYESGRRGQNWKKVKRPMATLDVVVTAAEQGHGRRASVLSDVTFAVRGPDRYLNIGKAYSGLTDEEIKQLTRIFRAATLERFGRVHIVKPEVVLEVAFDGVQKSPRHKSGFALRFPRILRWRTDKRPDEVDTLQRVEELYRGA